MRILHVLSQNELTGAEAYAITLIRHQLQAGHEVRVVSDSLNLPLPEGARYHPLQIDSRGLLRRLKNVKAIRKLIREFDPQVLHAHSRAASWVSYLATLGGPGLVSTVHGRQHWHTRFKLNDIYGQRIIAICGNLKEHLVKDFGISPKRIDLIRNIVRVDEYKNLTKENRPPTMRIGLFGRMSGPKGRIWGMLMRSVLPDLMAEFPNLEVLIGGGAPDRLSKSDRTTLDEFLEKYPSRARFFGHSSHLANEIAEVDFVIAAGRIAVEALYGGKKVFAFGEYQSVGWITRSSLRNALLSNFGDVGPNRDGNVWWTPKELWNQLRSAFLEEIHFDIDAKDIDYYFDEEETYRQVESSYIQAIIKKKYRFGIPALMFHKVVSEDFTSKHKTYIEVGNFDRVLRYLKLLRKETITFGDLRNACNGRMKFPKHPLLLTFDDGYRSSLELASPSLKKYGMRAILYLLADSSLPSNEWDTRIDPTETPTPLLSPDERKEISAGGVFEIGSHGLRHQTLKELTLGERDYEIIESKLLLEKEFGKEIISFAYAYGTHTADDAVRVNRTGYSFAVGTNTEYGIEDHSFRIFRANVFPEDGFFSVLKKSSRYYRIYFSVKRKLRNLQKK